MDMPAGVGKRDTYPPPFGMCQRARFASVTTFWSTQKQQNVTRHVLRVQNISKCGRSCAPNPAAEPTVLHQISQLHLSLFERRGWYGRKWSVPLQQITPNNTIP